MCTAAVVFDRDEDVEAAQEHGIDVGEVNREDRMCLRGQELLPGRHQPRPAQRGGHQSAQRADHGAVEPGQSWPGVRATQYRDLVAKRQNLGVLGGVGAGEQRQPAQHANEHQVDESEGHSRRSCWLSSGR